MKEQYVLNMVKDYIDRKHASGTDIRPEVLANLIQQFEHEYEMNLQNGSLFAQNVKEYEYKHLNTWSNLQ